MRDVFVLSRSHVFGSEFHGCSRCSDRRLISCVTVFLKEKLYQPRSGVVMAQLDLSGWCRRGYRCRELVMNRWKTPKCGKIHVRAVSVNFIEKYNRLAIATRLFCALILKLHTKLQSEPVNTKFSQNILTVKKFSLESREKGFFSSLGKTDMRRKNFPSTNGSRTCCLLLNRKTRVEFHHTCVVLFILLSLAVVQFKSLGNKF